MKVIAVVGPTAVGKTALTLDLAEALKGEIVNLDSIQIYRMLDIGSAKPAPEEFRGIGHHLFGVISPFEDFTVSDYQKRAAEILEAVAARGKVPILSGGTGLYLSALYYKMDFNQAQEDPKLRASLYEMAAKEGKQRVHQILCRQDPAVAKTIHPNNLKRVVRALEILSKKDQGIKTYREDLEKNPLYEMSLIGLTMDRKTLYDRIDQRVDLMMSQGLIDEVKYLKSLGLDDSFNSMKGIGYKEVVAYLNGEMDLQSTVAAIKQHSRRYAKRQLTWFRQYDAMAWFQVDAYPDSGQLLEDIEDHLRQEEGL
ncbi:MAG: hypothetical protein AVO33_10670 [delta proteobacterium ML8_F1]|nr:MAG: hypothetical protein AVO33_10670 [delta proteobacterium ML8_F1]